MSDQQTTIKLFLSESPGTPKKDFLAETLPLSENNFCQTEDFPNEIVINQYTREAWCRQSQSPPFVGESTHTEKWHSLWLKSVDRRGRIPGFIKFLKGRQKAAFGKFESPHPDEATGEDRTALFLVPFEQPSFPSKEILQKEKVSNVNDLIFVKYCFDENDIFTSKMKPLNNVNKQHSAKSNHNMQHTSVIKKAPLPKESKGMGGLLGSLLGAQERTNRNLQAVPSKTRVHVEKGASKQGNQIDKVDVQNTDTHSNSAIFTTSNQVIASFRSKIEKKLIAFQTSAQTETKIEIRHTDETRSLVAMEEKEKVTMEVLKYIVYEQSEEIGEDQWVAAKEPSEFTDEIVIAIYKAGCAPQEVLEEINKGEMPDEAKQQQRAMREALSKEERKKAKMVEEINMKKAFEQSQDVKRLNNVKRDRRSIEEIQRDMVQNSKRTRS